MTKSQGSFSGSGNLLATAFAASAAATSVTYGAASATLPLLAQQAPMSPQDDVLINTKIEAKTAELRGDIKLNTQAMDSLKQRVDDLSNRLASVPTDVAFLKATVAELPRKGFIVAATMGALVLVAALSAFVQWVLAAHILTGGH